MEHNLCRRISRLSLYTLCAILIGLIVEYTPRLHKIQNSILSMLQHDRFGQYLRIKPIWVVSYIWWAHIRCFPQKVNAFSILKRQEQTDFPFLLGHTHMFVIGWDKCIWVCVEGGNLWLFLYKGLSTDMVCRKSRWHFVIKLLMFILLRKDRKALCNLHLFFFFLIKPIGSNWFSFRIDQIGLKVI